MATVARPARPGRKAKSQGPAISAATIRNIAFSSSVIALLTGLAMYDYRVSLVAGGILGTGLSIFGEYNAGRPRPEELPPPEFRTIDK